MDKRDEIRAGLDLRLPFLDFAPVHFISALHGTGVGELMRAVSQRLRRLDARDVRRRS